MDALYWRLSYRELQQRIQRHYAERESTLLSQHNSMVMIISAALGGGNKGSTPNAKDPDRVDVTAGAQTVGDAVMMMNRMLSMG